MDSLQHALHLAVLPLLMLLLAGCNERPQAEQQRPAQRQTFVEPQIAIETIAKLMTDSGHTETMLQMSTGDPNKMMKMWNVGDGVLIVTYDATTNNSESVRYYISTGGPKLHRKNWSFPVETFDPASGTMTISIGNPENAG